MDTHPIRTGRLPFSPAGRLRSIVANRHEAVRIDAQRTAMAVRMTRSQTANTPANEPGTDEQC